jgi:hypothetical protein
MRSGRRRVAVVLLFAVATSASARAPAPLSADHTPARVDSTYGGGGFGAWFVDGFGLPAFRYDVDEDHDARAAQPELAGGTQAQHQVGNDHVVAAAFNHGYTQLWSQDRLMQWANAWDPATRHWAGGFGYLLVDGAVVSTLFADRPAGATVERDFGVGYARKDVVGGGVEVEQTVYAPFGDDPVLLDDVTITNRTTGPRTMSWFEYWDVDPVDQTAQQTRGVGEPAWDPATTTLTVAQSGGHVEDTAPLDVFAAAVAGPVDGFETSVAAFFGTGTRAVPAEVAADQLSGTLAPPSTAGSASGALLVFRAPVTLAPGASTTLRYLYGMAHHADVAGLVAKYRAAADPFSDSEHAWLDWLPKADFGSSRTWVARELEWDAYLLRSASVYEEVCGQHTITQGGYYQYLTGLNLGTRSWPHYLLPMVYAAPDLAREILRYTAGVQPEKGGQMPYGTGPLCTRFDLGTSSDLDFWLLLAAVEYGLGTRDTAFFSQPVHFLDSTDTGSMWDHVKLAYRHQESLVGTHGGYLAGTNGDWSDFSSQFLHMTESTLVTAQVAYVYPRLAWLAERLSDAAFAEEVRRRARALRVTMRHQWTGKGWYARGYGPDGQIGRGAIFGEPQPWAVLAGIPSRKQATTLVKNVRRFLDGVGAPAVVHGPSRIGSSLTPAFDDPDVTERASMPVGVGDNNANYVGGVWFDVNGWLTWALGELDGVVPGARQRAWDEYVRNTLATHATTFPDHWAGTISVDDTCYSYYATHTEMCGNDLYRGYDGQITEQPTWMVMDAVRLAGVTPTERGFRIAPHLPFAPFSLRLPRVGVATSARAIRGYVVTEADGPVELEVHVPTASGLVHAWAGTHAVPHKLGGGSVVFQVTAHTGAPADWAVTWTGD